MKTIRSTITDAFPSPGVNPLEGSPKCSCGKLGLERRSRLPTLERGRGSSWEPMDQTRKRDQQIKLESASKTNHKVISSHSGTPLGVGTRHGHFGPQDTPRPGLGGSHHLPPYSILCDSPGSPHPNGFSLPGLPRGSPEIPPTGTPGILRAHNFLCKAPIATRSEEKLQPSSRAFQRYVARRLQLSKSGRFPTFFGRESNWQSDSRF